MLKIEKKMSFVVAGIEFQEYKPAQFFKRALSLWLVDLEPIDGIDEKREAQMIINSWNSALGHPNWDNEFLVNTVMLLQLSKPARKPKEIQKCMAADDNTEEAPETDEYVPPKKKGHAPGTIPGAKSGFAK